MASISRSLGAELVLPRVHAETHLPDPLSYMAHPHGNAPASPHKRPTHMPGVDEFGVLTTSEYRNLVRQAADAAAAAAAAAAAQTAAAKGPSRAQSAPADAGNLPAAGGNMSGTKSAVPRLAPRRSGAAEAIAAAPSAPAGYVGAYGSAEEWQQGGAPGPGMGGAGLGRRGGVGGQAAQSRWHVAAEAFLARVVDRCTEFQLTHGHMLRLLQQGVQGVSGAGSESPDQQGPAGGRGSSSATGRGGGSGGSGGRGSGRGGGVTARTAAAVAVAEELGVGRAAGRAAARAASGGGGGASGGGAVSAQVAEEQVGAATVCQGQGR